MNLPVKSRPIQLLFIILLCCIVYSPVFKNGFTNWDDDAYVTDNPLIKHLSWQGVGRLFTVMHQSLYKPLTLLSFTLEYHFFGLHPFFYHLDNLILHILNSLLVFWFILLLSKRNTVAFLTSILFAIHPLHVESVAWITERKDVLYALFYLAAMISYLYYQRCQKLKTYLFCLFLFLLSLLSKPMAVTLPLVLFAVDFLAKRKFNLQCIREKIPFFILSLAASVVQLYNQYGEKGPQQFASLNNLFIASRGVFFYLEKTFLPLKLSVIYPYPEGIDSVLPTGFLLSPLILLLLLAGVIVSLRYSRILAFGSLFFIFTLLPVLQIFYRNPVSMTYDRHSYIPLIGIFYIFSQGIFMLYQKNTRIRSILISFIILALAILGYLSYSRCLAWRDSLTLWNDTLKHYPRAYAAYSNRGLIYFSQNKLDLALADYNKAIRFEPRYIETYYNRGLIYFNQGKIDQALADYNKVIRFKPNLAEVYYNRGNVYSMQGKPDLALADYNKAIQLKPDYAKPYINRGLLYYNQRKPDLALADYSKVIQLNPNYAHIYNNRGLLYSSQGKLDLALADYNKTIQLDPDFAEAYYNRANFYSNQRKPNPALADYNKAIQLKPDLAEAYHNRAIIYFLIQDYNKSWQDIHKTKSLGYKADPGLLNKLKTASSRER